MSDALTPIWMRRHRETDPAFDAFCYYRDMGEERSLRKVIEILSCNPGLIERWSKKHGWVMRVKEYDNWKKQEEAKLFHEQRLKAIRQQASLGAKLRGKAEQALDVIDPAAITAGEIARLADVGVKIERLAYGDSTANNANNQKIEFVIGELPAWAAAAVGYEDTLKPKVTKPTNPRVLTADALIGPDTDEDRAS